MSSLKQLLTDTKASSIPNAKGEIITIKSTETPHEAFKKLIDCQILSAPVVDVQTSKCTGFLDVKDLVSFVVFVDDDQKSDAPADLKDILSRGTKMLAQPTDGVTVTYLSRRNILYPIYTTDSLWTACEILAKGVHRVPVVNEKGEVVNIISQSTIINFLQKHLSDAKTEFSTTISDSGIGSKPVVFVEQTTSAMETFRIMDNRKLSSIAVVDNTGRLVGNTSASDLKLFVKTQSLSILNEPIMQYLNKIRQDNVEQIKMPTISCSEHDPISMLISKLALTKVHKIFIADDSHGYKPSRVVSITDIVRYVLKNCN